jgi:hypothetical protein
MDCALAVGGPPSPRGRAEDLCATHRLRYAGTQHSRSRPSHRPRRGPSRHPDSGASERPRPALPAPRRPHPQRPFRRSRSTPTRTRMPFSSDLAPFGAYRQQSQRCCCRRSFAHLRDAEHTNLPIRAGA